MTVFHLNTDKFGVQLGTLRQAGAHFQEAKATFYSHVKASMDAWSDVAELGQYGRLLTGTLAVISDELGNTSARYTRTIVNLQHAVASFQSVSEADRQRYLDALADLTDRFSYTPPAELAQAAAALHNFVDPAGKDPYGGLPAGDGVSDADNCNGAATAGDARADADRARAHANAGRNHGHP